MGAGTRGTKGAVGAEAETWFSLASYRASARPTEIGQAHPRHTHLFYSVGMGSEIPSLAWSRCGNSVHCHVVWVIHGSGP